MNLNTIAEDPGMRKHSQSTFNSGCIFAIAAVFLRCQEETSRVFQIHRSGCSFIHELSTGPAETLSFQRQRSCHRQASHP
jgi:hypothetical protein